MPTARTASLPAALALLCLAACTAPRALTPDPVVPSPRLVAYQQQELIGFIHFTINTFTGREWGYGDESPALFNPTALDVEQWVTTAKAAGMRELILTAKHHDGFCLWPSAYTEHDIAASPYNDGAGDVVREFVDACRKHGLAVGLYLSPWDRNHPDYGTPAYLAYYRAQLRELLTQYGTINEIWFDGANGGDGYYGGANEVRTIDRDTYYRWDSTFALVRELQPDIKIFSDAGPDVHWIGNERGFAGETFWSTMSPDSVSIGTANTDYLNTGDPQGTHWVVGQCDVSIRPGWFYHPEEDSLVKSPVELLDIYFKSVGRNAVLLLNLPPDRRGRIHERDVAALRGFRGLLDETFGTDIAAGARVEAAGSTGRDAERTAHQLLDGQLDTYWSADDTATTGELIVTLPEARTFDVVMLQEPIQYGQRVRAFTLEVREGEAWRPVYTGTTIGYKRLVRIDPVTTAGVRVRILEANGTVAIVGFGLYRYAGG